MEKGAEKEIARLPKDVQARIAARLLDLSNNPRPPGCVKMKGRTDEWRIRVGQYRVVYRVDNASQKVTVTRVRHRSDAYRH